MGWYHSHPGYGCWLSGIDVGTQVVFSVFAFDFFSFSSGSKTLGRGLLLAADRPLARGRPASRSRHTGDAHSPLSKIQTFSKKKKKNSPKHNRRSSSSTTSPSSPSSSTRTAPPRRAVSSWARSGPTLRATRRPPKRIKNLLRPRAARRSLSRRSRISESTPTATTRSRPRSSSHRSTPEC